MKVWENSKKLRKHSPAAHVFTAFLVLPNFHSCLCTSIETRYMFIYSLHLARKYARICIAVIVCSEKRTLFASRNKYCPRTNIRANFRANGGYCVHYPSNIFLQHAWSPFRKKLYSDICPPGRYYICFREANSFPRVKHEEQCELFGKD